jgi:hypothetical protein
VGPVTQEQRNKLKKAMLLAQKAARTADDEKLRIDAVLEASDRQYDEAVARLQKVGL